MSAYCRDVFESCISLFKFPRTWMEDLRRTHVCCGGSQSNPRFRRDRDRAGIDLDRVSCDRHCGDSVQKCISTSTNPLILIDQRRKPRAKVLESEDATFRAAAPSLITRHPSEPVADTSFASRKYIWTRTAATREEELWRWWTEERCRWRS